MTVVTASAAYRYELPLTTAVRVGGTELRSRAGFLIELHGEPGPIGYGEVAPLPGLHREDLTTALRQFQRVQPSLAGWVLDARLGLLDGGFDRFFAPFELSPSLRHGLETAALNLLAADRGRCLAALLSPHHRETVTLNGLITGGDDPREQARALAAAGYPAVKIKVGRAPVTADIERVRRVREVLDENIALRVDANRAWDWRTAVEFARAFSDGELDYVEEPLAEPSRLAALHEETGLPLALDESLGEKPAHALAIPAGTRALVLKPAVLGGFERVTRFVRLAERLGLKAVPGSVFESGVGLAAIANYAAALLSSDVPLGLDTYRWLGADVTESPFSASGARVAVETVDRRSRQPRLAHLERVA